MKFSSRLAQRECAREIDGSGRERARQKGMQQTGNTNLFFTIARTARIGHFLFIAKLVGRHFHAAIAIRRTHSHCHSHTHAHTLNGIYIDILSAVLYRRQRSQCEQCSAVQRSAASSLSFFRLHLGSLQRRLRLRLLLCLVWSVS